MTKVIPPLDLSWLLMESPASTTHVGALLLFKKPAGRRPTAREIVQAYRGYPPTPPFNYVPELLGLGAPHFRELANWDAHYHIEHLIISNVAGVKQTRYLNGARLVRIYPVSALATSIGLNATPGLLPRQHAVRLRRKRRGDRRSNAAHQTLQAYNELKEATRMLPHPASVS